MSKKFVEITYNDIYVQIQIFPCHTRFFKVDFIAPYGANKSIICPPHGEKNLTIIVRTLVMPL